MSRLTFDEVTKASIAVRDAVAAYDGRVRSVDSWRSVAAEAIGKKRLIQRFWDEIIEYGSSLGLFSIDNRTYSYPVIKIETESNFVEDDDLDIVDFDEEDEEDPETEVRVEQPATIVIPRIYKEPEDWDPPHYMDCGHSALFLDPEDNCTGCEKKVGRNWRYVQGDFAAPVPVPTRRTQEKTAMGGFPGLCCDSEGMYIGGLHNDCRRSGATRCSVHATV